MGAQFSRKRRHPITKKEEEAVTSQRLHEFFGATLDVELKGGLTATEGVLADTPAKKPASSDATDASQGTL